MPSFWTKAALMAAHHAGNDSDRPDLKAEHKPRASISRDPSPPPKSSAPTEDQLRLRLAEEVEYARRMLSALGDELSADALVVSRHLAKLQTVEIVAEMLGHIASVVRSSDPPAAVNAIGMGALKARLLRKNPP